MVLNKAPPATIAFVRPARNFLVCFRFTLTLDVNSAILLLLLHIKPQAIPFLGDLRTHTSDLISIDEVGMEE